jgi:hypothetical protein
MTILSRSVQLFSNYNMRTHRLGSLNSANAPHDDMYTYKESTNLETLSVSNHDEISKVILQIEMQNILRGHVRTTYTVTRLRLLPTVPNSAKP